MPMRLNPLGLTLLNTGGGMGLDLNGQGMVARVWVVVLSANHMFCFLEELLLLMNQQYFLLSALNPRNRNNHGF